MRYFRVIFVSLIAIGVCGGIYIGLTVGLAAYMSYRTGGVATASAAAAPEVPAPADVKEAPPPVPAMEDAASLLRRTWTAPRAGLTAPPPFVQAPSESRSRIVAISVRPWLPPTVDTVRPRHQLVEKAFIPIAMPAPERLPMPVELALAPPEAITFPSLPPARTSSPESNRIRLSTIATDRSGERPSPTTDSTVRVGEQLLLAKPAPLRTVAASPEKLVIPNPNPYEVGPVRTALPDEAIPATSPDRPEAIRFDAK